MHYVLDKSIYLLHTFLFGIFQQTSHKFILRQLDTQLMNPKSTLNNNVSNDLFYEWIDLFYNTHTMSLAFLKNKGKILTSQLLLLTSKFYPCICALLSKLFPPSLLKHGGGSRQLPFLLNVYHKVTHTHTMCKIEHELYTLFMLNMYLACHIVLNTAMYVDVESNILLRTSMLSKTPFFQAIFCHHKMLSNNLVVTNQ